MLRATGRQGGRAPLLIQEGDGAFAPGGGYSRPQGIAHEKSPRRKPLIVSTSMECSVGHFGAMMGHSGVWDKITCLTLRLSPGFQSWFFNARTEIFR